MTAEAIDAAQALNLGLVTAVHDSQLEQATALAAELATRSPDAVAAVKKLYDRSWNGSRGMALFRETLYQIRVMTGANQRIAVKRQLGEEWPFKPGRKF